MLAASSMGVHPFWKPEFYADKYSTLIMSYTLQLKVEKANNIDTPCWGWADGRWTSVASSVLFLSSSAGSVPRIIWRIIQIISLKPFITHLTTIIPARNATNFRLKNKNKKCADSCGQEYQLAGHNGQVVTCLTAVWEDPGLNLTVGCCVYDDSHHDIQPAARAEHPYCNVIRRVKGFSPSIWW